MAVAQGLGLQGPVAASGAQVAPSARYRIGVG
jgi:hypothetical protein